MKMYYEIAAVGKMHRIEPWDKLNDLVLYTPCVLCLCVCHAVIDTADFFNKSFFMGKYPLDVPHIFNWEIKFYFNLDEKSLMETQHNFLIDLLRNFNL